MALLAASRLFRVSAGNLSKLHGTLERPGQQKKAKERHRKFDCQLVYNVILESDKPVRNHPQGKG